METSTNKNTLKEKFKSFNKKKVIISILLISIAFFGSFFVYFILQISLNTPTPVVVVVSGSMAPNINKGDLLFIQGKDAEDIKNGSAIELDGDVIVFDAWGLEGWVFAPQDPVVHRVIDKWLDGSIWYFQTKGDANPLPDPVPVPEDRVLGAVIGGIPFIGWIKIVLTDTGLVIPLLVIVSTLLVITIIWDIIKGEDAEKDESTENEKEMKKY
ncbi:MAG: signal peptidase I [Promethearchaeota archaeon]|nr:MAG: signal peptidase I [Candidatus Lokiarchaeota archaeon]